MAQYETTATAMAKGSISYQFTCIKCGQDASVHRPIEETETLTTYDRHINVESFKMQAQAQAEQKLLRRLHEIEDMSFIKKCELIGGMGKCPHCGELQPWSKIGMIAKPATIFMDFAIWLGIGAVITVIMGIFGKFYYEAGFLLLLPPVVMSLIGLVIGIFSNKKYSEKIDVATEDFQKIPKSALPRITIG